MLRGRVDWRMNRNGNEIGRAFLKRVMEGEGSS